MEKLNINQTEWNLKSLYNSDDDPKMSSDRKIVLDKSYEFINKWKDRSDYLEDPQVLEEALREYEVWANNYGTSGLEGYYLTLRTSQDQKDPILKAKYNKLQESAIRIGNDIQFFTHRLAKITPEVQKAYLEFEGLKPYKHYLEKLFEESKYLLSEDQEKIISVLSPSSFENWVRMTSEFLSKESRTTLDENETEVEKSFAELFTLMTSKKKNIRDRAAKEINDILYKNIDVAEHEINSILGTKKSIDELRKIQRPDMARHISDDIDTEVVDTLVETVSNNFHISNKWYEFKSKLLGLPKLEYHERMVEYGSIDKKFDYDEAINIVYQTFNRLDPEFGGIVKSFVENGQIDVFPRQNKYPGAFCTSHALNNPVFILLNYERNLDDVLTVAHEFGHAVNDELMKKSLNYLNFGSPLSTAEVASTFMEDFVWEDIVKQSDEELQLTLMVSKVDSVISTIQRQIAGYKFEQELHNTYREKGYLPKEEIGQIFQKNMKAYMGEFVEQNPGSQNWWTYWSHFRSFFYVYSYASGLLISMSLQNSVRENPSYITKVKEFLSTGSSDTPANIFSKLGINIKDPTFWEKGLKKQEQLFTQTVDLAKKLGKI